MASQHTKIESIKHPYWVDFDKFCRKAGWESADIPISELYDQSILDRYAKDGIIPQGAWRIVTPEGFGFEMGKLLGSTGSNANGIIKTAPTAWFNLFHELEERTQWVGACDEGQEVLTRWMARIINFLGDNEEERNAWAGVTSSSIFVSYADFIDSATREQLDKLRAEHSGDSFYVAALFATIEALCSNNVFPFSPPFGMEDFIVEGFPDYARLITCGRVDLAFDERINRQERFFLYELEEVERVVRQLMDLVAFTYSTPFMTALDKLGKLMRFRDCTMRSYKCHPHVFSLDGVLEHEEEWMDICYETGVDELCDLIVEGVPVEDIVA